VGALLRLTQPRDAEEAADDQLRSLRTDALEGIIGLDDKWWSWVNLREVLEGFGLPTALGAAEARTKLHDLIASGAPYAIPGDDEEDEEDEEEDEEDESDDDD
jgi:hypothetical protein